MNKQLEEAVRNIKEQLKRTKIANECGLATKGEFDEDIKAIETVLSYIENSIPKEKVEEKIELIEDTLDLCKEDRKVARYKITAMEYEIEDLKELLEGK